MTYTPNRQRSIQIKFFVNTEELDQIKQRMIEFGTDNLSAHLRTLALNGTYEVKKENERSEAKSENLCI